MATNIPPHNLSEIIEALKFLVNNPQKGVEDLLKFIKGPDFPTGGIIIGKSGIREMYITGKGSFTVRGRVEIKHERKRKSYNYQRNPLQREQG